MRWEIGIDEAGRGPVIGPLVITGIKIPIDQKSYLEEIGVKDSKKLTSKRREELYHLLESNRDFQIVQVIYSPAEIDMAVNTIGLNMLEVEGFSEILNRMGPIDGSIIVDACDINTERFAKRIISRLKYWTKDTNMVSEHKADDRHISVAAASIVAKYIRDKHIKELEESLGLEIGSGYPSDPKTIGILPKLMQDDEPNEHLRWSWKTVKEKWEGDLPKRMVKIKGQETLF